jgi:hypothetical protein
VLAATRLPDGLAGAGELHALVAVLVTRSWAGEPKPRNSVKKPTQNRIR